MPLSPVMQQWIQIAGLGWPVIVALGLQLAFFRLLNRTGKRFSQVSANHEAFDFQNKLTAAEIYEQIRDYTTESKRLYNRFFVIDFFFPLFASLFLSLLWAVLLPRPESSVYQQLLRWNAPLFAFLPALFDWGENVCFVVIINRYPKVMPRLAQVAVIFKRLKLITLFATIGITLLLLVVTLIMWVQSLSH